MKKRELVKKIIPKEQLKRIKNNQCPVCEKPKSKWNRRTDWRCCSEECTAEFWKTYISYGWQDIRLKAFERDNYTCVKCGDNRKEVEVIRKIKRTANLEELYNSNWKVKAEYKYVESKEIWNNFIGDHIKPIALGGDEWDLKNIQTLCIKCNKIKTKEDMKDIAKQRRIEKKLIKGQKQIK